MNAATCCISISGRLPRSDTNVDHICKVESNGKPSGNLFLVDKYFCQNAQFFFLEGSEWSE